MIHAHIQKLDNIPLITVVVQVNVQHWTRYICGRSSSNNLLGIFRLDNRGFGLCDSF